MTPAQKATLKLSEKREALARFSGPESEVEALRNEIADLEVSYRTALTAEDTVVEIVTPESRELATLIATASVGDFLTGVMEHRASSGPLAELQQHHHLAPNQLPIELLALRDVEEARSYARGGQCRRESAGNRALRLSSVCQRIPWDPYADRASW